MFKKKALNLSDNAPEIMFWVASIALVLFELRVLDVIYVMTESYMLAIGALFATGAMFFVWKVAFQYTLASSAQVWISSVMMFLSLLASGIFGGMDYIVRAGVSVNTGKEIIGNTDFIFYGLPLLGMAHIVALLLFWYFDPVISAKRKSKQADDLAAQSKATIAQARDLLSKRTELMAQYVDIANTYGKQAAMDMLDALGIDKKEFENVDGAIAVDIPMKKYAAEVDTPNPTPVNSQPVK